MKALTPFLVFSLFATISHAQTPEPEGYHGEPYRGEVPLTLEGATVLNDETAFKAWEAGAHFVDVLPRAPKPKLPKGTIWHEKDHHSIKNAIWLPNVGYQALADETLQYFKSGLDDISQGELDAPIVFFCQMECWMSWNAAKRALEMGYQNVSWYPDGVDGWDFMDYPMEALMPWGDVD